MLTEGSEESKLCSTFFEFILWIVNFCLLCV